jgi:hypothetical protein
VPIDGLSMSQFGGMPSVIDDLQLPAPLSPPSSSECSVNLRCGVMSTCPSTVGVPYVFDEILGRTLTQVPLAVWWRCCTRFLGMLEVYMSVFTAARDTAQARACYGENAARPRSSGSSAGSTSVTQAASDREDGDTGARCLLYAVVMLHVSLTHLIDAFLRRRMVEQLVTISLLSLHRIFTLLGRCVAT